MNVKTLYPDNNAGVQKSIPVCDSFIHVINEVLLPTRDNIGSVPNVRSFLLLFPPPADSCAHKGTHSHGRAHSLTHAHTHAFPPSPPLFPLFVPGCVPVYPPPLPLTLYIQHSCNILLLHNILLLLWTPRLECRTRGFLWRVTIADSNFSWTKRPVDQYTGRPEDL